MSPPPDAGPAAGAADGPMAFLADLAEALHVAYLPADAVEDRIGAAARGLGLEVEAFALQSLVLLERRGAGGAHLRRTEFSPHYNLSRLDDLVVLSDAVAGGRLALPGARTELERILAAPPRYSKPVVVLAYAVFGSAVAARVGGGVVEMLAAGLAGLLAGSIHLGLIVHPTDELEKSFLGGFGGALTAFLLSLVLPPFDATRAIFGAMALLVPAIVITAATLEVAHEAAVEAGVVRLVYGLVRFIVMGAGVLAAANLWSLLALAPAHVEATHLPFLAVVVILVVGGAALTLCLHARPSDAPWIVVAVVLAWGTQELTKQVMGDRGAPFVTALVLGVGASLYGRLPGRVPATMLIPGMMQIAPGFLGTQSVLAAIRPGAPPSTAPFFDVLVLALQLSLGVLVAVIVTRRRAGRGAPPGTAG